MTSSRLHAPRDRTSRRRGRDETAILHPNFASFVPREGGGRGKKKGIRLLEGRRLEGEEREGGEKALSSSLEGRKGKSYGYKIKSKASLFPMDHRSGKPFLLLGAKERGGRCLPF